LTQLTRAEAAGLRAVALFEAFKGLLGIAAAIALLALRNRDFFDVGIHLVNLLRLGPGSRLAGLIYEVASRASAKNVGIIALFAFLYTAIRFTEAYGLWHERAWAEWFAIISGSLYLPLEIHEVMRHANWIKWGVLIINVLIVLYMCWLRWEAVKQKRRRELLKNIVA
jgi:uncharacterized membrane protein (DUF2068 family)